MRRTSIFAGLLSLLTVAPVLAQGFPPTLPPNTVYGRLGIPTQGGPGQAIPMAQLRAALGFLPGTGTVTSVGCGTGLSGGTITGAGSCAVVFGATAGTVVQGNDARVTGAAQVANNLSDLASAATARTNLGLGSIATQASNALNVTGVTQLTGLPACTGSTDACPKSYIDLLALGFRTLPSVRLATAAVLPNTPTYANGTAGVGATLTAGANAAIVVDGVTGVSGDSILVKDQVSTTGCTVANAGCQNGVYTVTTVGDGSNAWVLTRRADFDTAAEMLSGSIMTVTAGATNISNTYNLQSTVTTVGTTPATFNLLFTQSVPQWTISGSDVYRGSGNVGIGGAPAAWSGFKALQVGSVGYAESSTGKAAIDANVYWNGSAYKYLTSSTGGIFGVNGTGGSFEWYTAPSGTATNTATMTKRMELSNTGTLTLNAYGAGIATFDASGNVSSKKGHTTSVTYCADSPYNVVANTGVDQTTALSACIAAACIGGANTIAQMPGGVIKISDEIPVGDAQCIIQGTGIAYLSTFLSYTAVDNSGTRIDQVTLNKNTFHHTGYNAPQFRDFTVVSPIAGPPTSGACIYSDIPNPALVRSSIGLVISRVACVGGAYCWVLNEAGNAIVEGSWCWAPQIYGLYNFTTAAAVDSGDSTFRDIRFYSGGQPCAAAIRIRPGGGLLISGVKILGCDMGVHASALNGETGTIIITSSSLEEFGVNAIRIDDPTPGVGIGLGQVTISNNEFLNQAHNAFQGQIAFIASAANYLDRFTITGNNFGFYSAAPTFNAFCMDIEAGRLGVIADNVCEMFNVGAQSGISVVGVASRVAVTNNSMSGAVGAKYNFTVPTNFMDVGSLLTAAQLPTNITPGSFAAVADGNSPSSPCTGSGTGTGAVAIAGSVWKCH